MIAIVCVDNAGGMLFNKRRQSQDKVLRQRIMKMCMNHKLWMNSYSFKQFADEDARNILTDEKFYLLAAEDDFCFIETDDPSTFADKIKKLIVYRWNRDYPADTCFTLLDNDKSWKLDCSCEFEGFSHEKITEEVYTK